MRVDALPLVLIAALAAAPVAAQDPRTVGTISDLQEDTLVNKARLANAKAAADLSVFGDGGTILSDMQGRTPPVVAGVYGANGDIYAEFIYANGSGIPEARLGAKLPGGYTVVALSVNEVTLLDRDGRRLQLSFSGSAPQEPTPPRSEPSAPTSAPIITVEPQPVDTAATQ